MSSKIRILDELTINQIAAGEVIEHPASVIKELVENAIDADAQNISIEILVGGRQLIRIIDDGIGMTPDDALLSIERHATSKIRSIEDLNSALSMGFRGEALASIAAISKMKLLTRKRADDQTEGSLLLIEGGKLLQHNAAAAPPGTLIEIKSLFFNTPARRKFQKSIEKDIAEVLKTVNSLALAHPEISFQLISNQKLLLKTSKITTGTFLDKLQDRMTHILGGEFLQDMCPFSLHSDELHVQGFISKPHNTRHNRSGQYLFINKRSIICPLISLAVLDGYGTLLSPRRYPSYVLHIELNPSLIDVNVHPQKREVRLRKEALIRKEIACGVERALHIPKTEFPWENCDKPSEEFCEKKSSNNTWANFMPKAASAFSAPKKDTISSLTPAQFSFKEPSQQEYQQELFSYSATAILTVWPPYIIIDTSLLSKENALFVSKTAFPLEGLLFIDQKLAKKRVLFDAFLIAHKKTTAEVYIQELLIPLTFEFSKAEAALLQEHLQELNDSGIAIRYFGNNTFIVDALSEEFSEKDLVTILHEFLSELSEVNARKNDHERIALSLAKATINKMPSLTHEQATILVQHLFKSTMPTHCPQGKPTFFFLEKTFLTKKFTL